tara:strand:+ start:236 stop:385 length:150 start_codon:yes stop_codon:yes gene_type:complete
MHYILTIIVAIYAITRIACTAMFVENGKVNGLGWIFGIGATLKLASNFF